MTPDWAMVVITTIYVIATIFICWVNYISVKVSKEQLIEMQKQFEENNRPYVEVELVLIKRVVYGLRFINNGSVAAHNVSIELSSDFVDSLEPSMKRMLKKQDGKKCIIGAHQSYDLYFATCMYLNENCETPAIGIVIYFANGKKYEEHFSIDLKNHMTIFSVDTYYEDILNVLKNQNSELCELNRSVDNLSCSILKILDKENKFT